VRSERLSWLTARQASPPNSRKLLEDVPPDALFSTPKQNNLPQFFAKYDKIKVR